MKASQLFIGLIIGVVIGIFVGKTMNQGASLENMPKVADAVPAPTPGAKQEEDVFRVPVANSPQKGSSDALVTIVEWSDFQCPFCSRVGPTLKQIEEKYKESVRVVFKQNPLPFHNNALPAAEASLAAHAQGKFWEMHDKLFANQAALDRPNLEKYAAELGLNIEKFKQSLDSHEFKSLIEAEQNLGNSLGARGTPAFFINGKFLSGAQPFENFANIIDQEMKKAEALVNTGIAKSNVYNEIIKNGRTAEKPREQQPPQQPNVRQKVDIGQAANYSAVKGAKDAKVTIIEFSDFECPFCSRVTPTVEKILQEYKDSVKFVFRHNPLPFHKSAEPTALATLAAGQQGKFWEMHDKLFANQRALGEADIEKYATELGLNMTKYKNSLQDPGLKKVLEEDKASAAKFGARGTPSFFINGVKVAGALPFEAFKGYIDAELKKADEYLKQGTPLAKLYDTILEKEAGKPVGNQPQPDGEPADDGKPVDISLGASPIKGSKTAKVTIVEFSDFECPFCSRVGPTLKQIEKEYGDKVKIVFKHSPLPFHKNAKLAAAASIYAQKEGKFWEMHDKLFENQKSLERIDLEKYATEIGLNSDKFKKFLDSNEYEAVIQGDLDQASKVQARGTPTFFINGRRLVGAQPFDRFKQLIDEELKK